MSLLKDVAFGFLNGFVSGVTDHPRLAPTSTHYATQFVRCCGELGWHIDERYGNDAFALHFNDLITKIRKVTVICTDKVMLFNVSSAVDLTRCKNRSDVLAYLLARNSLMGIGAWVIADNKDGTASFDLKCILLLPEMCSGTMKNICETLVKEIHDFDVKMKDNGLL